MNASDYNILLVAEGETEIGSTDATTAGTYADSIAMALLDNVCSQLAHEHGVQAPNFTVTRSRKWHQITASGVKPIKQNRNARQSLPSNALAKKVIASIILAKTLKCDGLFILVDQERAKSPSLYEATDAALAQGITLRPLHFLIVGNPCRSIETWLLVDYPVCEKHLHSSPSHLFTKHPEDRPEPDILKSWIAEKAKDLDTTWRECMLVLAKNLQVSEVERRCNRSFPPFLDSVRAAIQP